MTATPQNKTIDPSSIVQGLDSLVSVNVDTAQLTTVVSALVESIRLLNDDVSRMSDDMQKFREVDQKNTATEIETVSQMVTQELKNTRLSIEEHTKQEIGNLRAHFESHREGLRVEVNGITAAQTAQRSAFEETLNKLEHEGMVRREEDLTRISDLIDSQRASMQTAFTDLTDDVQKNRDAVKLLNDEVLRRDNETLQHRKRKDEEEARMREEIQGYGREINSLRHYSDSLGTDIVSLRTDMNTAIQKQNQCLDTKADKDTVNQSHEILLQHVGKGDTEMMTKHDEWAQTVRQKFQELEEIRQMREQDLIRELTQLRADRDSLIAGVKELASETDKIKLDMEQRIRDTNIRLTTKAESDLQRLSDLSKHAEQSSEKFMELDKVLDTTTFRLAGLERELITQNKDIVHTAREVSHLKAVNTPGGLGGPPVGQGTSLLYPSPSTDNRRSSGTYGQHGGQPGGGEQPTPQDSAQGMYNPTAPSALPPGQSQSTAGTTGSPNKRTSPPPGGPAVQPSDLVNSREALLSRLAERERNREMMRENLSNQWLGGPPAPLRMGPIGPAPAGPLQSPAMGGPLPHAHPSPRQ